MCRQAHKSNLVDEPEDAPLRSKQSHLRIDAQTPENMAVGGKKKSKQGVALCVCVSGLLVLAVAQPI